MAIRMRTGSPPDQEIVRLRWLSQAACTDRLQRERRAQCSTQSWVIPRSTWHKSRTLTLPCQANHLFLPHNGRNITVDKLQSALATALNFDADFSALIFSQGPPTNPTPNQTLFDLEHLGRPDILEHDASLSRKDSYFGNALVFDAETFEETKQFWHGDMIDRYMLQNSKVGRQLSSKVTNPTYTFTTNAEAFRSVLYNIFWYA